MPRGKKRPRHGGLVHDTGLDMGFFDNRKAWLDDVRERHPLARVFSRNRVSRAYIGEQLVAVWGSLPGHGYVAGPFVARILHAQNKQPIGQHQDFDALRGRHVGDL